MLVNWIDGVNVSISDGTITKISGGNGYNAGAEGDQLYQSGEETYFKVEVTDLAAIAFGFTESAVNNPSNTSINFRVQLSTNGAYNIYANGTNINTGTYTIGDIFKLVLENGVIKFYLNDNFQVVYNGLINYPIYVDGSIYKEGFSIKTIADPIVDTTGSIDLSRDLQSHILIPHVNSLNMTEQMTIEFWIKLKPLPNDFQAIIDKGNIGTTQYYVIHEGRNGNNQIKYRFGNGHERTLNRPNTIVGNWTYMSFTFDGANMAYYENGDLVISENFPGFVFSPNTMDLTIGQMSYGGAYLDAILDEVRIWSVARSPEEIKNNMMSVDENSPELVGYWKFDPKYGETAFDSSPKKNHGYLMDNATYSLDVPSIVTDSYTEKTISLDVVQEIRRADSISMILEQNIERIDSISMDLDQTVTTSDVARVDLIQGITSIGGQSLQLFQTITSMRGQSLQLFQEITSIGSLSVVLGQEITSAGDRSLQFVQEITGIGEISIGLNLTITSIGDLSIRLLQEIHSQRETSLDLLQEILTIREISLEVFQQIRQTDAISLDVLQIIRSDRGISLDLTQRLGTSRGISLGFVQEIIAAETILLELMQTFGGAQAILIPLRAEIYRDDQSEYLYLQQQQFINNFIPLQLNQDIRLGVTGASSLSIVLDLYSRDGSILDLELQSGARGERDLDLILDIVTPIIGEINLSFNIRLIDYLNTPEIIGEIRLAGARGTNIYLTGDRDLYIYLTGDLTLYEAMTGGIDMTKLGQDFAMFSGDTKILIVTIDEPISLADVALKWGLRKNKNTKESLFVKTLTDGVSIEGETIEVRLDPIDTEALSGDYYHEMELTDLFGNVSTLFVGKARIETSGV